MSNGKTARFVEPSRTPLHSFLDASDGSGVSCQQQHEMSNRHRRGLRQALLACALSVLGCGDPLLATVGSTDVIQDGGTNDEMDSSVATDVGLERDARADALSDASSSESVPDAERASTCVPLPDLNHLRSLNDAGKIDHFDVEGGVRVAYESYHACDGGMASGELVYSLINGEPIVNAGTQHWLFASNGLGAALSLWVGSYENACERTNMWANAQLVGNFGPGCNTFQVNKNAHYLRLGGGMLTAQLGATLQLCAAACP